MREDVYSFAEVLLQVIDFLYTVYLTDQIEGTLYTVVLICSWKWKEGKK